MAEADLWYDRYRRVVPQTPDERRAAADALRRRCEWRDIPTSRLAELLDPWFDAGWCWGAILHALDYTYDGRPQRHARAANREKYIQQRLDKWIDGFKKRRSPPVEATSRSSADALAAWHAARQGGRSIGRRTDASRRARQSVRDELLHRRRDRVQEVLDADRRVREAMERLGPSWQRPSHLTEEEAPTQQRSQRIAAARFAAAESTGLRNWLNHLASQPQATRAQLAITHGHYREARYRAIMAELEAMLPEAAATDSQYDTPPV